MDIVVSEIQRFANTVKLEAATRMSGASAAQVLEEAIFTVLEFGNVSNQTALLLLREMEMTQSYRELGYNDLSNWAHAKLTVTKSADTVSRLVGVIMSIVAPLDAEPMIIAGGEKVTGLSIIEQAAPSTAMKLYGAFAHSDNGERENIVNELISGSADIPRIMGRLGREPRIGKAAAVFTEVDEDTTELFVRGTPQQLLAIEKAITWLINVQFVRLP